MVARRRPKWKEPPEWLASGLPAAEPWRLDSPCPSQSPRRKVSGILNPLLSVLLLLLLSDPDNNNRQLNNNLGSRWLTAELVQQIGTLTSDL